MFFELQQKRKWSEVGLRILIASVCAVVLLALADGYVRAYIIKHMTSDPGLEMLSVWIVDFRYIFEQAVYASTIFFVGAKFFETRTILTIGFDKLDASKMVLKGPDEQSIVWIGHRYGTRLEAQAIAESLAERLKESGRSAVS